MNREWLCVYSLWLREMKRFYRQPSRVIGALASPLMFWILIGSGIGRSFQAGTGEASQSYLEYFFPGTVMMILLFTAIFSTISIIEDRREGFLQSVLVSPASRGSIVMGKILGGTSLAVTQAALFLLIAPLIGLRLSAAGWAIAALALAVNGFALTGLGFLMAWRMNSIQGFHAVMNVLLMPLWFLSGALFPADGAQVWLKWVMVLNPLTYGMAALRHALEGGRSGLASLPDPALSWTVICIFAFVMLILSAKAASRRSAEDLQ
ncbi:MAG: multidrug ABC transporter permease [Candidatus Omnitrophica bacterium]|nr:multidrug ABC transporter permease [Candidatus Omnitrophota bacterium]